MEVMAFGDRLKLIGKIRDALKNLDWAQVGKLLQMLKPLLDMIGGGELKAIMDLVMKLLPLLGVQAMDTSAMAAHEAAFTATAASAGFDIAKLDQLLKIIAQFIDWLTSLKS